MRLTLITALLLAGAPAAAQQAQGLDGRVNKLEREMRAVQRKVFPGGAQAIVEPEISAPATGPAPGSPASAPIVELGERVSTLEQELARLTGQIEQNGFRLKQIEEQLTRFRGDAEFRLNALEGGGAAPPAPAGAGPAAADAPASAAATPAARTPAAEPAATAVAETGKDPGEDAYLAAYRLWEAKNYDGAEAALKAYVAKYPKHRRTSYAQNLLGRTYLDSGRPAAAATAFLTNYNKNPRGERAPDSLYYLGQSLMKLDKPQPEKACQAYGELLSQYGQGLSASLRDRTTKAQAEAKCS